MSFVRRFCCHISGSCFIANNTARRHLHEAKAKVAIFHLHSINSENSLLISSFTASPSSPFPLLSLPLTSSRAHHLHRMASETSICWAVVLLSLPVAAALVRLIAICPGLRSAPARKNHTLIRPNTKLTVLLGSGGHTGEMLRLLHTADVSACTRTWLVSLGDTTSLEKARDFEDALPKHAPRATYAVLHRARRVREPLVLSVISTLRSAVSIVREFRRLPAPDILLLNGPGTSVPVAYVVFGMHYLGMCRTRIVYVESLARVNRLSLSGLLLLPIADRFVVQWRPLAARYRRAEYHGILV